MLGISGRYPAAVKYAQLISAFERSHPSKKLELILYLKRNLFNLKVR